MRYVHANKRTFRSCCQLPQAELYNNTVIKAHTALLGCFPCRQFFLPFRAEGHDPIRVVILVNKCYSQDTRRWIQGHPYYRHWVTYLKGSVFEPSDLNRASARSATACFVLTQRHNADDSRNVLRVLALKRFVPGLPLYILVDSVQKRQHLIAANVPNQNICCVDVLKMGLIAQNCMTPGTWPYAS